MAVGLASVFPLLAVEGVRLGSARAAIRKPDRRDLMVMEIAAGSKVAARFTRNAFCAAPVQLARRHLDADSAGVRYLLVNTGNANAGTGAQGLADAQSCCRALADRCGCAVSAVLPFSTGVIGEPLPVDRVISGIPEALGNLDCDGWAAAAEGIMTTDTRPKGASRTLVLSGTTVTVSGIAKGSGMIKPAMATMLSFIATDALIEQSALDVLLGQAVDASFNCITVDGDTSTNDACVLVATGRAANASIDAMDGAEFGALARAVREVCIELAQAVIRDAEGATKFVGVRVCGGADVAECRRVAYAVAESPLVKTALFASDPNWGRILAATGRAGVEQLEVGNVAVKLNGVCIVEHGGRAASYTEQSGQKAMSAEEIDIEIDLGRGVAQATVWTSDLSHDYVRINAEYRS